MSRKGFSSVFHELIGLHGFVFLLCLCLKAWTLSHSWCALSAAACVVIGWQWTVISVCSIEGSVHASCFGREFPANMGRGYGRRHLRHNLCLTAQPLSTCSTLPQCKRHVCVALWVYLRGLALFWHCHQRDQQPFSQMLFSSFQHLYIQRILYIPATQGTKTLTVVMSEIKHAED